MTFSRSWFFLALGLAALPFHQGAALAASRPPALVIDNEACHFAPQIDRLLQTLPQHFDMGEHTETRAARFSFEKLHGVGIAENWDAEWSEYHLYFREDLPALRSALQRLGLRVDEKGSVAVPAEAQDDRALSVEAVAAKDKAFPEACSYLTCGSV